MKVSSKTALLAAAACLLALQAAPANAQVSSVSQVSPVPTQYGVRHAYQTARYSENVRRRYAPVAIRYVQFINYSRGKRTSLDRAIEAGRTAEGARRAYYTRHRGTGFDGGTRRAYSS